MARPQLFDQPDFIIADPDCSFFGGKVVGFTGHRGVLGGILYERLQKKGIDVRTYLGDVTKTDELGEWFKQQSFDYFFHLAAKVPVGYVENNLFSAYDSNVIGTFNVFRWIAETQKQCWIFFGSTSHVYAAPTSDVASGMINEDANLNPTSLYGATKLHAENMIRLISPRMNLPVCIGRIFSFSHVTQKEPYLVPSLLTKMGAIKDGESLEIINPDCVRDILDAETVVDCMIQLARNAFRGVVNVGSGEGLAVRDIAYRMAKREGKFIRVEGQNRQPPNAIVADTTRLRASVQMVARR